MVANLVCSQHFFRFIKFLIFCGSLFYFVIIIMKRYKIIICTNCLTFSPLQDLALNVRFTVYLFRYHSRQIAGTVLIFGCDSERATARCRKSALHDVHAITLFAPDTRIFREWQSVLRFLTVYQFSRFLCRMEQTSVSAIFCIPV